MSYEDEMDVKLLHKTNVFQLRSQHVKNIGLESSVYTITIYNGDTRGTDEAISHINFLFLPFWTEICLSCST